MTTTAHAGSDGPAATAGGLPSVASGITEVIWPLYLTLVVALGAWVVVPTLVLGWNSVTIVSGSMEPSIQPGHVVVFEPYDGRTLEAGTVVTFRDHRSDRLITHRIVGTNDDGTLRTRGDNSPSEDPTPLTRDRIVGLGRLVVPAAGLPALWMHHGRLELLAALAALTVLAATPAVRSGAGCARAGALALRRRTWGRLALRRSPLRPRRRTALVTAGALAVVSALATITVASAAFAGTNDNPANSFEAGTLLEPTDLGASASCQLLVLGPKVELSWTASANATGYVVLRSTTSGSGHTPIGTTETASFSDTGVSAGTTYHYVVQATAGSWLTGNSNEASATTPSICL